MTETLKELLEKYEQAKLQEKEATAIMKELRPDILKEFPQDQEISSAQGVFTTRNRPTWKYSPELTKRKEDVKTSEGQEQADGTAQSTDSISLVYTENKEE